MIVFKNIGRLQSMYSMTTIDWQIVICSVY